MTHPAEPLLIVGPVTWDLLDGRRVPGGAVSYAARVATAFGVRAHVLVNAAPDADLAGLAEHEVCLVESDATCTFEHQFSDGIRSLVARATPGRTLTPDDVPGRWPQPRTLILAPLLPGDIDLGAFVQQSPARDIAVLAQGLQRRVGESGRVELLEEPAEALVQAADDRLSIFLASEETASWPLIAMDRLVATVQRVILTHGRSGTTIHRESGVAHVPATPVDPVDTTGAGDVFATAFILALRAGDLLPGTGDDAAAGRVASMYAAANIGQPGAAPLPPWHEIRERLEQHPAAQAPGGGATS